MHIITCPKCKSSNAITHKKPGSYKCSECRKKFSHDYEPYEEKRVILDDWKNEKYNPLVAGLCIPSDTHKVKVLSEIKNFGIFLRLNNYRENDANTVAVWVDNIAWLKDDAIYFIPEWVECNRGVTFFTDDILQVFDDIYKYDCISLSDIEYFMIVHDSIIINDYRTVLKHKTGAKYFNRESFQVFEQLIPDKGYMKYLSIPQDARTVEFNAENFLKDGRVSDEMKSLESSIWIRDSMLFIEPKWGAIESSHFNHEYFTSRTTSPIRIPTSDIDSFIVEGEVYRENRISGGGGGGSDIGGAIIGGVLAGGVGAVIGSRKESDAIRSELVTHDTRKTYLDYFINGTKKTIEFRYKDFEVFNELIPEKNNDVVSEIKKQGFIQQSNKLDETKTIAEQIRELAGLKDDGILTEDEFASKKAELLAKM
jgi:hypothetical protein